ncbi:hypothetical protein [Sporosarcina sp. NCCP-2716]|uniref:hypothetical protein n=1 Tax=Sporosarcina sp. NCCP-2716 TaxID=2943679 RepID=UPI00203F4A01|nr:hypothetical protein [Sporosarcina sp. NCCP-2716]
MVESQIEYYERESRTFNPIQHVARRLQDMESKSDYGAMVASKWKEIVNQTLQNEVYPVVHPIGQETFSLYAEFPTGVFEYALDIDGATSLIKEESRKPKCFMPTEIISSVEEGNINKDVRTIKTNHKNPIMVLQSLYITGGQPYCINGNHRIFEAHRHNERQVEVYVFNELEFIPFFYDMWSKAIYFLEMDYYHVMHNETNVLHDEYTAYAYKFTSQL